MKPKVIAVVGPTASGKTAMAINLAKEIGGEIISADSRLVYKGFDIASAKPTIEEREGIPHHLIDIVEPEFDYSVGNFYKDNEVSMSFQSSKGTYNAQKKVIMLYQDTFIVLKDGMTLKADRLRYPGGDEPIIAKGNCAIIN